MPTHFKYALPVDQTDWKINGESTTTFQWNYDERREHLLSLYSKGKSKQWDSSERIDWSQELDPENPMDLPNEAIPIYGSDIWNKMTEKERTNLRRHHQAYSISQFLHGEQGALVCAARIVQQAPDIDAKFYAATQVMDEARHVEAYSRLLYEKFELAYPISKALKTLLEQILRDSRWDITYLGMQVMIEGLALAAFQRIRDQSQNRLAASINAYVMQDEARHVGFGRLALRDFYPQLTETERREREEFVIEASYYLRDRFRSDGLWEGVGLPSKKCMEITHTSATMVQFRRFLFSRIVPTIKYIGLWGDKVQKAYEDIGVIEFAKFDPAVISAEDDRIAEEFDLKRRL